MALPTTTLRAFWDCREWETTMFTGVGSGAPSIGANIRQWVDTVGSFTLTAPSDATRPNLQSGAIGGQAGLNFTAADAEGFNLSTGVSGLLNGTGGSGTFFYVIETDSIDGTEGTELHFDGVGFFKVFLDATNGLRCETANGNSGYLAAGKTLATPLIISVRISPTNVTVGVNGTEGNPVSLGGTWTYNNNANLVLRSGYAEFDGRVAAILVYNSRLDDTDFAAAVAALDAAFINPQVVGPDVTTSDPIYVSPLDDITGLVRWVDYIPVQTAADTAADKIGTYENDGALYTQRLDDLTNKVKWVDYIPVYITADAASGRWRTDNDGWIPVTEA